MKKRPLLAAALLLLLGAGWLMFSRNSVAGKGGRGSGGSGLSYRIVELDSSNGLLEGGAEGISNNGLIVGQVYSPILDEVSAACWTLERDGATVTSTLHLLDGEIALGVNDAGEIVGRRDGFAAYWPHRNAAPLMLPGPVGTTLSAAGAINENGVVCGWLRDAQGDQVPVVWRINIDFVNGEPTPAVWGPLMLPAITPAEPWFAACLSDNDGNGVTRVVGASFGEVPLAQAWAVASRADGTLALVGNPVVLDIGEAYGVNNAGQICGRVQPDAVLWEGDETRVLDRSGVIKGSSGRKQIAIAQANAINATGVIVGYGVAELDSAAVAWPSPSASMIVLNDFLRKSAFSSLDIALAVNDAGEIVGSGWDGNRGITLGFVAIPE